MEGLSRVKSFGSFKREFKLDDACDFVQSGVQVGSLYIQYVQFYAFSVCVCMCLCMCVRVLLLCLFITEHNR